VAGAGWIGLESAAAAHSYGCHVTIVDPGQAPLLRVLGPELGGFFADLHRAKGVELRLGEQFDRILGEEGKVRAVVTSGGQQISADIVIIGVGVTPNTGLAETAGLMVDNGIVLDASLRSSDSDIYAAGDVANADHPLLGGRIRVEHWANALNQGPVAARAMLGQQVVYDRVPYFFTDQYELGMEYTGYVPPGGHDELIIRGDLGKGEFIAFWLKDRVVLAGMNVNIWDVTDAIRALVSSRRPVDTVKLADPDTPLEDLLAATDSQR
jgi:3-phenylpropionate/trans-cinnamate dioxygenase ferredoxin reductase subunit